jgi:hypothetical protein
MDGLFAFGTFFLYDFILNVTAEWIQIDQIAEENCGAPAPKFEEMVKNYFF